MAWRKPRIPAAKVKELQNKWETKCFDLLVELTGKAPKREYKFHKPKPGQKKRLWRFDFAFLKEKVAVEVEGGTWTGSGHIHPLGFAKDCVKYNAAGKQGWTVYRVVPEMINKEYFESLFDRLP